MLCTNFATEEKDEKCKFKLQTLQNKYPDFKNFLFSSASNQPKNPPKEKLFPFNKEFSLKKPK
jgi:hypothetical protein